MERADLIEVGWPYCNMCEACITRAMDYQKAMEINPQTVHPFLHWCAYREHGKGIGGIPWGEMEW